MISVGVVGATGYAGGELVRLLLGHPNVRLAGLYGRNRDNQPIETSHPHLSSSGLVIDQAIPKPMPSLPRCPTAWRRAWRPKSWPAGRRCWT